jgi:hypothetical protein
VRRRAALALLAAAAPGCGYSLVGKGITTDPSVRRIGVPLFVDQTGKPGLDARLTQAVIAELLKRGRFTVVKGTEGVDAVVEGEIITYNVVPIGFSESEGQTQANRYVINLVAKVRYRKIGVREPLWSNDAFALRDEYDISGDPASFFDREDQTIERIAEGFARNLVAAMLEAF